MSKKKKITIVESSAPFVEEYKNEYVRIVALMKKAMINRIRCYYTGSGDSGGVDEMVYGPEKKEVNLPNGELNELIEEVTYNITGADFNNDGSSGTLVYTLVDNILKVQGDHEEYYTESNTTSFDNVLVDENKIL